MSFLYFCNVQKWLVVMEYSDVKTLYDNSVRKTSSVTVDFKRYLFSEINWNNRLIGIKFMKQPCFADLTRSVQNQRFSRITILPFDKFLIYKSFHCYQYIFSHLKMTISYIFLHYFRPQKYKKPQNEQGDVEKLPA